MPLKSRSNCDGSLGREFPSPCPVSQRSDRLGKDPWWHCGQIHKLCSFLYHLSSLPVSLTESGGKRKGSKSGNLHWFTLPKTAPGALNPSWEPDKNQFLGPSAGLWKMRPGSLCCTPQGQCSLQHRACAKLQSHLFHRKTPEKRMFSVDKTIYFHYGSQTFLSVMQYNVFITFFKI